MLLGVARGGMGQPDACATAAVQSYDTLKEDKYEQLMIDMEEGRRDSLSNYVYACTRSPRISGRWRRQEAGIFIFTWSNV